MSKYKPLRTHLDHAVGRELPMRFSEIEAVLGFPLPASARNYPAWWSNTHHNPAVQTVRGAGWSISRVDLPGERLTFVRDSEGKAPTAFDGPVISIDPRSLSANALSYLTSEGAKHEGGVAEALVRFVNAEAPNPKKALLERFVRRSKPLTSDSTALIREDRDGR